jgi:hypothetical protein
MTDKKPGKTGLVANPVIKQDDKSGQFVAGTSSRGRMKGSRNRLHGAFVSALEDDFREYGPQTIVIVRTERPAEYLKIVAAVLPKEFFIEDGRLENLSDEELAECIELLKSERARIIEASEPVTIDGGSGTKTPLN